MGDIYAKIKSDELRWFTGQTDGLSDLGDLHM